MLNRRYFIGATASCLFTPLFAQTTAHKFTLGEMEISVFSDGIFSIPLSLALPQVKPLSAKARLMLFWLKQKLI
jgi:hypothetical protein